MTREDRQLFRRSILMLGGALFIMALAGYIILWHNPSTELDKKCMNKALAEIGQCMQDYHNDRSNFGKVRP